MKKINMLYMSLYILPSSEYYLKDKKKSADNGIETN